MIFSKDFLLRELPLWSWQFILLTCVKLILLQIGALIGTANFNNKRRFRHSLSIAKIWVFIFCKFLRSFSCKLGIQFLMVWFQFCTVLPKVSAFKYFRMISTSKIFHNPNCQIAKHYISIFNFCDCILEWRWCSRLSFYLSSFIHYKHNRFVKFCKMLWEQMQKYFRNQTFTKIKKYRNFRNLGIIFAL